MSSVFPGLGLQIPVFCLPSGQNFRTGSQIAENRVPKPTVSCQNKNDLTVATVEHLQTL